MHQNRWRIHELVLVPDRQGSRDKSIKGIPYIEDGRPETASDRVLVRHIQRLGVRAENDDHHWPLHESPGKCHSDMCGRKDRDTSPFNGRIRETHY